ncbi:MAG: uroporphyrinogen-III synthase [Deltaproteobacteria bacterium]|nr:uroporphyrinogen-III synthase [Deltaproteobacteria bacterium]
MTTSVTGYTAIITRAEDSCDSLAESFGKIGILAISFPVFRIETCAYSDQIKEAFQELHKGSFEWLILTSINGVRSLHGLLEQAKAAGDVTSTRLPPELSVAVQGKATATAFKQLFGREHTLLPGTAVAEDLCEALLRAGVSGKRILLAMAARTRGIIKPQLERAGADVRELVVYSNSLITPGAEACDIVRMQNPAKTIFIFFSPSAVVGTIQALGENGTEFLARCWIASIGPITSAKLREIGVSCDLEASEHDEQGVVKLIRENLDYLKTSAKKIKSSH